MASKRKLDRKRQRASGKDSVYVPAPRRARRVMRRLAVMVGLLLIAVLAAPTIIANTSLRDTLLGMAMPAGEWHIESRESKLTWSGKQKLSGILIVDADNKPVFSAESIIVERSLLALAVDRNELGRIEIERPVLHLSTRADGSNVEDLVAAWQAGDLSTEDIANNQAADEQNPSSSALALLVEIVDGLIQGQDADTGRTWELANTNLSIRLGDGPAGGLKLSGSAQLVDHPAHNGTPTESGRIKFHLEQTTDQGQKLVLLADQLPLGPLQPWVARVLEGGRLAGRVSADATIHFAQDAERGLLIQSAGRLDAGQLYFTADAMQGDVIACNQLAVPWKIAVADGLISVESLAVDSPWAQLRAAGSITLDELAALDLNHLPKQVVDVAGSVDIAQLAAMLPRTLQLRQGVRIDSGQVNFKAQSARENQGYRWLATVAAENVTGADGAKPIRWEQPIEATAQLVETPRGARLEQLSVSAPFAQARLQTSEEQTGEKIDGQFNFDLEQLSSQLGQFVDLSDWQIRGGGTGRIQFRQTGANRFEAAAEVDLNGVHVAQDGKLLWSDPQLKASLSAGGEQTELTPTKITTATVKLRGARDNFDATLLEPIDLRKEQQAYKIQLRGTGPLESWAGRLRPWVAGVPTEASGEATLEAQLAIAEDSYQLTQSKIHISQLHLREGTLAVDEPRLELTGDCRWDSNSGSIVSRQLRFVTSTVALVTSDLAVVLNSDGVPAARGSVAVRANLERLAAALGQVGQPDSAWPRGAAEGNLTLSSDANSLRADFTITANQMQLVSSPATGGATYGQGEVLWSEPQLQTAGRVVYSVAEDRLQLEDFRASGQTVQINALATVDKLQTEAAVRASGTVKYDPAALAALLASYLGPEVQLHGNQDVSFQVAGTLADPPAGQNKSALHWSQRWQATAAAGWASASAYGIPLGAGSLQGELRQGQLQIAPLDVAVEQGRLQLNPRIVFDPGPQLLQIARGPLITNVQVSPRVSESLLKYVAPILAGATRAEGIFSVDLDDTQVPLETPELARVAGRLTVHRLRIAPGPMANQLVTLVKQVEALSKGKEFLQTSSSGSGDAVTIENRQIDFQVADGRVYHRNLEFLVDGVPVRSYGSVGFDQTLSLMLEIPVQDKWIEREKAFRPLAGQTLKFPITGTFQRPRIDERAVADLSRQLLEGAVGNEINRQLEKLFK